MDFEMKNKNFEKVLNRNEFCLDFLDQNVASEIASDEMVSGQLSVEIEAKRPGRKGAAQTPSAPSERKSGSSKNKPGSAGQKSDNAISFSLAFNTILSELITICFPDKFVLNVPILVLVVVNGPANTKGNLWVEVK